MLLAHTASSPLPVVVLEVLMLRQVALRKLLGDGARVLRIFQVRCVEGQEAAGLLLCEHTPVWRRLTVRAITIVGALPHCTTSTTHNDDCTTASPMPPPSRPLSQHSSHLLCILVPLAPQTTFKDTLLASLCCTEYCRGLILIQPSVRPKCDRMCVSSFDRIFLNKRSQKKLFFAFLN